MNTPPHDTLRFVSALGDGYAPDYWQRPELMMSNQQFQTPSHDHRLFMRPKVSPNRQSPYKVDLCLKYRKGNCNYGDKCRFAHIRREPPVRFDNPSGSSSSVSTRKMCWRFSNWGQCPYGERCHFIHGDSRKSFAISVVDRGGGDGCGSGGDCRGEVKIGLNAGKQVDQRPLAVKTRLCNKWVANGNCPYGLNCIFAHGESELLMKSENGKTSANVTSPKKQDQGKQWVFKYTDIEKISRIYADWIENTSLVHDSSDVVRN